MNQFEHDYKQLVNKILCKGYDKNGRNGKTKALFGEVLEFNVSEYFPIVTGRKMFYKGVLGELAAFLKKPKHKDDFKKQGCNYWELWSNEDGALKVDYGNAWLDFNGVNQLDNLMHKLKHDPDDRRLLITGWNPSNLDNLSLPCCHYAYQFFVHNDTIDMLWHQRSCDTMIGLPSDVILAAAWLIIIANECGYKAGTIKMTLGDTHIYNEHIDVAKEYLDRPIFDLPTYTVNVPVGTRHTEFTNNWLSLNDYRCGAVLNFLLKV